MADDKDLSPLDKQNAEERRITLEGPKDPDGFKMPDGSTFSATRRKLYEQQVEQGQKEEQVQAARVREQSIEHDPLYNPGGKVVEGPLGTLTVIPAPSPDASKESLVANTETTKSSQTSEDGN